MVTRTSTPDPKQQLKLLMGTGLQHLKDALQIIQGQQHKDVIQIIQGQQHKDVIQIIQGQQQKTAIQIFQNQIFNSICLT